MMAKRRSELTRKQRARRNSHRIWSGLLERVSDSRFIGREDELSTFSAAIRAERPPFTVLYVHGAGGVGKTTLLRRFASLATDAGRSVVALDGRDIQPSRLAFLEALGVASGKPDATQIGDIVLPEHSVVLIDTYELLLSLETWLRDSLLPALTSTTIVVLAGRAPPELQWRTDVAWQAITRVTKLDNFARGEAATFLESRGIAPARYGAALDFAHGHPLALSLVSAVIAARGVVTPFDPSREPDVVGQLLSLFLQSVPNERARRALEICAIARVTDEPLLRELFGPDEGSAAFDWLRSQSFVESGARGLYPHDLAREVLLADASWRDFTAMRTLARRIYRTLHARIAGASPSVRQRQLMDALYVTRTNPTNADFFDWSALGDVRVESAAAEDVDWIVQLISKHEGAKSAALARQWWQIQPDAFHVMRRADESRFGFLALLDLARSNAPDDPAVPAALDIVARHGPVRRGEAVVHLRWWMHAEQYQAVTAAINLTAMHVISRCMTQPGMAWNFVAMADPDFWATHFAGVNFARVPDADFEVDDRHYGVFAHEWRIESPTDWVMGAGIPMPFAIDGRGASGAVAMNADEFREAVRAALRSYTRTDALANSDLLTGRVVPDSVSGTKARAVALQAALREAADALKANPRDSKLHRAVWLTYFEPLATQEQVAERLGLPFSTYRHHLTSAIDRICAHLWVRERSVPRP